MANKTSLRIMHALAVLVTLAMTSIAAADESLVIKDALIFEAEARVASLKSLGQWVEIPTNRMSTRRFVAVMDEPFTDQPKLVHIRTDYYTPSPKAVSTRIMTVELDCDKGLERLIVTREFGLRGAESMKTSPSGDRFLPVTGVFASPQRYVCTGEYLLDLIPNGHQRLQEFYLKRRAEASVLVPDRMVQVPVK